MSLCVLILHNLTIEQHRRKKVPVKLFSEHIEEQRRVVKTLPCGKDVFALLSVRFDASIAAKRRPVTSPGVIPHANREPRGSTGDRLVSFS